MATRLKTIEYWFPELAAVTDNTDTNFTQITVYIPETVVNFRSVVLDVIIEDAEASSNNVSRRQISIQLASAGYSVVNNTNVLTSSSEQKWLMISGNFTSYFTTNWTGTSMTCDGRVLCDSAIASPSQNWRCATARLTITYEYDDTAAAHIKTIKIPLVMPIANLATSKPGSPLDTIPALDTFCPEAGKTFRQYTIIVQGNEEYASTTDAALVWEVDTLGSYTTGIHEHGLNTSVWFRHSQIQSFATNATHSWYAWCATAMMAHLQAFLVVTYEFDPGSATSTILNSLILPLDFNSPAGGTTNADYQRASRNLYIAEPTTITIANSAIFFYWEQAAAVTGIQYRVNSGSWSGALTSTAATVAGSCGSMFRCETAISLARGLNTITADIYRTDTADYLFNLSAFIMLNYTSGKHADGVGAHNHSVTWNLMTTGTVAAAGETVIAATAVLVPEADYIFNAVGGAIQYQSNGTGLPAGVTLQAERLAGEGGIEWENIYADFSHTDALTGVRYAFSQCRDLFRRWPNDAETTRLDIETSRRYRFEFGAGCTGWANIDMIFTYHTMTWSIAGTISGSNGGTINLYLIRPSTTEFLKATTTSGDGAYSISWYDDTSQLNVMAFEDDTHKGVSKQDVAGS